MAPFGHLANLFRPAFDAPLAPDRRLAVVGDVHGRADLLDDLLALIRADAGPVPTLVWVGDYIDRGEQSAQVLERLQQLQRGDWPGEVVCLMGNHEAMLLDFLDDPEAHGPVWLRNGGAQTLASFGLPPGSLDPRVLQRSRDALHERLPAATQAWLRALPTSFRSGNVFVAHAGADPGCPVDRQEADHLLWGHPDFARTPRRDGLWVAHGHTIHPEPVAAAGRISVDTGAYATHRLTAALITPGGCRFLSTAPARL